jgi:hypothetical protein
MDKKRLRGFLKVHVFKKTFTMSKISEEGNLQVFKIGSVIAACSDDTEVSSKAILDYLMTAPESMALPFFYKCLSEEEIRNTFKRRIFSIRGGGAYFL